jgi:hypothetical protein
MNQQDVCCRVINKLLNQLMKNEYNYDFVFYLNPVQHLMNKKLNSDFYMIEEIVSINLKSSINMYQYDRLCKDLKDCLNMFLPFVECSDFRKINKVKLVIRQRVVSGILHQISPTNLLQS